MNRSVTGPVFAQSVVDLLKKIEGYNDTQCQRLRTEATDLQTVFATWVASRPEPDQRAKALDRLIELNRKVLVYISKKTRGGG